jgi:hypothetical protein
VEAFGDSLTAVPRTGCTDEATCDWFNAGVVGMEANLHRNYRPQNRAFSGQQLHVSFDVATAHMSDPGIKFATFFPWSQNDSPHDAAHIQSAFDTYAQAFIDLCHSHGVIPILMTLIPSFAITTSADDAGRLSVNTQIKALAASDVLVVDMDAVMTDGASPARIQSSLNVGDGVHPNAAGAALMQAAFQTVLQSYVSAH